MWRRITGFGQRGSRIYTIRMWAARRNLLAAAKAAGVGQLIYTSTVATIAVDRPELPNEFTDAKLEEMIGHYKRSKWMAEQEALNAAKEGLPVIVAMPTTPVGPWDWKPTPTGKIILDFLNGKMPGYVETGLNFVGVEECAAGHLLVAEAGKIGERYLLGAENLTLKEMLDTLAKITGLPAPGMKIPHGVALGVAYVESTLSRLGGERTANSGRRREDRAAQDVRGLLAGTAGIGISSRERCRRRWSARCGGIRRMDM